MTEQELHVINSLKGKPADFVALVMAIIPDLIQAVEESGWIKINDENQPPNGELVRIWNETFQQEMIGKYIHHFSVVSTVDEPFEGDTEYDEETDQNYWPSGWYVFCEHAGLDFVYGHCLDIITHYKPLTEPLFIKNTESNQFTKVQQT